MTVAERLTPIEKILRHLVLLSFLIVGPGFLPSHLSGLARKSLLYILLAPTWSSKIIYYFPSLKNTTSPAYSRETVHESHYRCDCTHCLRQTVG